MKEAVWVNYNFIDSVVIAKPCALLLMNYVGIACASAHWEERHARAAATRNKVSVNPVATSENLEMKCVSRLPETGCGRENLLFYFMVLSARLSITTCRQLQDTVSLFHLKRGMRLRTYAFHLLESLRLFPLTQRRLVVSKRFLHSLLANDSKKNHHFPTRFAYTEHILQ